MMIQISGDVPVANVHQTFAASQLTKLSDCTRVAYERSGQVQKRSDTALKVAFEVTAFQSDLQ